MSATPRLRSGYPSTPGTVPRRRLQNQQHDQQETPSTVSSVDISSSSLNKSPTLPLAPERDHSANTGSEPRIPITILDAPQQRFYAFGFYLALWAWKLYDWLQVLEDGDTSWLLFLKWIFIDFIFLFGLPSLRIPWLELSNFVVTFVFATHLVITYMLMFNIPLPWQSFLLGFVKILYDREISVSEHNVKISNILSNHSLIRGKQIINILPEGSAVLNPEHTPFCLDGKSKNVAELPIYFNSTIPAEIEFIRVDLDTNKEQVIKISKREVSKVARKLRDLGSDPDTAGFLWHYKVKKPGVYRLGKVLDEYKLEVQRTVKDTYVVPCPQARILPAVKSPEASKRCIRDISDLSLEVVGTPPLKIVYSRTTHDENLSFHFQSLQPDDFSSPLVGSSSNVLMSNDIDISWVRPSKVTVNLNESMNKPGEWLYMVDEVHDAFGNVVNYSQADESERPKDLMHKFMVNQRPKLSMKGCDLRRPLKVAKGRSTQLPVDFQITGRPHDTSHEMTWDFSPIDTLTNSGDHGDVVSPGSYSAKNSNDKPRISEPGLYTLKSISSGSCDGEVIEPLSCLLLNPLQPHLSMRSEEIPDKCAGNSVGLRVNMDLVGTPPFVVKYDIISSGQREHHTHKVSGLRSQLELVPKSAGRFKYEFRAIDDAVYANIPLTGSDKALEQVVKPEAYATIQGPSNTINACLDSNVEVDVALHGDPPFTLEWEFVHDGKRKTERATDIEAKEFKIKTAALSKGGEYILALVGVQDKRGCRTFLQDQMKIAVRRQRPRGGFGVVEQKRQVTTVADVDQRLPLRLQGEGPWTVSYKNLDGPGDVVTKRIKEANGALVVKSRGTYELVDVADSQCPGDVDLSASKFQVEWFPRPELSLVATETITGSSDSFVKQDVCEGDIDGFEIDLKGAAPFRVKYEIKHRALQGSNSISPKDFDAALSRAAISMDTSRAGDYTYKFSGLTDNLYYSNSRGTALTLKQRVNPKPSAAFTKPGQTFKFCMEEQEQEDKIPLTLTGTPPFNVEVEIKSQAGSPPETYSIPSINSNSYNMQIPRKHLRLGSQQVRVRQVRDARGCQQKYEISGGPSVQIHLYDAPSIYPLESREDYCVGERIAYTLSGTPPFDISYDFNGRWNAKSQTTNFRRVAEKPGEFTIVSVADKASECRAAVSLPKTIHPLPSVQISKGKQSRVDIHEGNEVDIVFDFWGTPPFEFTYTRSTNAKRSQKSVVLETRHDVSLEHTKVIKASQEGTYEVVAIKDKYCSFSTQQVEVREHA